MDAVDQRLISILRHDGRRSISDLAHELAVSRGTVRARLAKLEAGGAIIGYTVVLRADAVAPPVRGLTMIEVEGRMLDRVIDALVGFRRGRRGPHHQRPLGFGGRACRREPHRPRRRPAPAASGPGRRRVGDDAAARHAAQHAGPAVTRAAAARPIRPSAPPQPCARPANPSPPDRRQFRARSRPCRSSARSAGRAPCRRGAGSRRRRRSDRRSGSKP